MDLAAYLESLDPAELAAMVEEQAAGDWSFRERLLARAAAASGTTIDVRRWRKRLESVLAPDGDHVGWREASAWAAEVYEAIDSLEDLIDAGHAAAVVGLAEHAHRMADAAAGYVDDSGGGELSEISSRLADVHLRACTVSEPDPVALAGRLVDLELTSELDGFHRAAVAYASVLGAEGLAEYRRLVEPRWKTRSPKSDTWSSDAFRVREAMIGVALASGDPDELARVKVKDLHHPGDHLEVAEAMRAAGRNDDAMAWCRRGLETFGDRTRQTPPLRDLLAELLHEAGEADEAVALFREELGWHPSLAAFRRLLAEADVAGGRADERDRAFEVLRARVAAGRGDEGPRSIADPAPASVLVEVLLFEGEIDEAWTVASEHGCAEHLWLALARAREADHPLEVFPIYRREVFARIDTRNNDGYRRAVDLLDHLRDLATRAGAPDQFDEILAEVRTTHKAKRNLEALLDRKAW